MNNCALVPIPSRIQETQGYRGAFGSGMQWCTPKGSTEDGEWFEIDEDGMLYDVYAFKPRLA